MQFISLLMKRMYWFHDALQAALEPNGVAPLTRAQAFVFANIAAGETKASAIARNLGVSRQAISQVIGELTDRGIIMVTEDPNDGRSRIARLGPEFENEGEVCFRIFQLLEDELGRRIGQRKVKGLREALESEWGEPPVLGTLPPPD